MNCRVFRKHYTELLDADGGARRDELARHREACAACGRFYDEIAQTLSALEPSHEVAASHRFKERVMKSIVDLDSNKRPCHASGMGWWKPASAVGALAVIVLALCLGVLVHTTSTYSLAQTVDANQAVRSFHIKNGLGGQMAEAWAEFDEWGQPVQLRMDFAKTEDGPKIVTWEDGKASVLFLRKRSYLTLYSPDQLQRMNRGLAVFNPRAIVDDLYEKEANDELTINVENSPTPGGAIVFTVVTTDHPNVRRVFEIDSATKLLQKIENYRVGDGEDVLMGSLVYSGYNEPIDPDVFDLKIPDDVIRIDRTTQEVGLVQGDLSDKEIAIKVAREFFEAMIAKDWAKAGKIYSGVPADWMEKKFSGGTVASTVRIVSIGEPTPHFMPGVGDFQVPCTVEIEKDGVKSVREFPRVAIRALSDQPGRWNIHGGL